MKWPYTSKQHSQYTNKAQRQAVKKVIEEGFDNWWEEKTDGCLYEFDYEAYENAVIGWFETGQIDQRYLRAN